MRVSHAKNLTFLFNLGKTHHSNKQSIKTELHLNQFDFPCKAQTHRYILKILVTNITILINLTKQQVERTAKEFYFRPKIWCKVFFSRHIWDIYLFQKQKFRQILIARPTYFCNINQMLSQHEADLQYTHIIWIKMSHWSPISRP